MNDDDIEKLKKWKEGIEPKYIELLRKYKLEEKGNNNADSTLETNFRDAVYLINREEGQKLAKNNFWDLWEILERLEPPEGYKDKLTIHFSTKDKPTEKPSQNADGYDKALSYLLKILKKNPNLKPSTWLKSNENDETKGVVNNGNNKRSKKGPSNSKSNKKTQSVSPVSTTSQPNNGMDKLDIINKAFRSILPTLVNFVGNSLKEKDNLNWKSYAKYKLSETTLSNLHLNGSYENFINNLDFLACLNIIKNNWNEIFKFKLSKNSLNFVHELITARTDIKAHETIEVIKSFDNDQFERLLNTMILLIDQIDKDITKELRKMKNNP